MEAGNDVIKIIYENADEFKTIGHKADIEDILLLKTDDGFVITAVGKRVPLRKTENDVGGYFYVFLNGNNSQVIKAESEEYARLKSELPSPETLSHKEISGDVLKLIRLKKKLSDLVCSSYGNNEFPEGYFELLEEIGSLETNSFRGLYNYFINQRNL